MNRRPSGAGGLVVLPTLNERENLPAIVPAIFAELPKVHVLVVDDRSPDGTGALALEMARAETRLHVLERDGPPGLGLAYLAGFAWALERPYTHVFEMDADFSHRPEHLPDLLAATAEADLALGCRYMTGGGIEGWGLHRLALSRGGNLYARAVLGLPLRDLTGGFKCFRREVLEGIDFGAIRTRGYGFQIELTWAAVRAGFRVCEVPIVFPDRLRGSSKMSLATAQEAFVGVLRMRLVRPRRPGSP